MTKMRALAVVCVTAVGLGGCAVTSLDGQRLRLQSDAYADYVERVFRLQSDVSTELAFLLADENPGSPRYPLLEDADDAVWAACLGLNELAAEQQNGDRPGGLGALQRARAVPECERAATAAAELLAE